MLILSTGFASAGLWSDFWDWILGRDEVSLSPVEPIAYWSFDGNADDSVGGHNGNLL